MKMLLKEFLKIFNRKHESCLVESETDMALIICENRLHMFGMAALDWFQLGNHNLDNSGLAWPLKICLYPGCVRDFITVTALRIWI